MSQRTIYICDRCGAQFNHGSKLTPIYIGRPQPRDRTNFPNHELCPTCTTDFANFMKGVPIGAGPQAPEALP